ncbi:hypothetical protein HN748_06385 [Candidatus Peregrinibacteria bacterium]|jgi:hypothetical protein|nr:hypothetical protein [Candidatus Peregrinibacteria bacterium]MBT7703830.1 hypothetical protein [Candidatus Peregrinibacteria bacterium]
MFLEDIMTRTLIALFAITLTLTACGPTEQEEAQQGSLDNLGVSLEWDEDGDNESNDEDDQSDEGWLEKNVWGPIVDRATDNVQEKAEATLKEKAGDMSKGLLSSLLMIFIPMLVGLSPRIYPGKGPVQAGLSVGGSGLGAAVFGFTAWMLGGSWWLVFIGLLLATLFPLWRRIPVLSLIGRLTRGGRAAGGGGGDDAVI